MQDFIMNTVSPILQALILGLIPILLALIANYITKKTGITIKQEQLTFVEQAAVNAVRQVEGRAMRKLSEKGEKWVGEHKHAEAINRLLLMAPEITDEQAKGYVDLAVSRVPGIGKQP